jgi:ABC-type Na+ transport system ATPase subunit NatA
MSAVPIRQHANQPCILKLYNTAYTLDPYHDRLTSQGFDVYETKSYKDALDMAPKLKPCMILVYDDPASDVDAVKWIELQHMAKDSHTAITPLLILADSSRMETLRTEELPDRVVVLQRRADTLNQLTRTVKRLLKVWDLA